MLAQQLQLCLTLCNPSGSSFHGILQAKILEWVAMHSSGVSSQTELVVLCLLCWQVGSLPPVPSWEAWIDLYTELYIKQITNNDLVYSTGISTQPSIKACIGREFQKEWMYICIYIHIYT